MNKRIKKIVIAMLLLLFAACLVYHFPVKKKLRVTVCTVEGETAEAVFDVWFQRILIYPTVMNGTITFDGREYEKVPVGWGSISERIRWKLDNWGAVDGGFFCLKSNDIMERAGNLVDFHSSDKGIGKQFKAFSFTVIKGSTIVEYYGPAETAEEAEKVRAHVYQLPRAGEGN